MSLRTLLTPTLAVVLSLSALTPVASAASFSDVPSTHPNAEAIAYVKDNGLVGGYPDGTYRPNQRINRAEFAKILEESIPSAIDGIHICSANPQDFDTFSDVRGEWFWIYVCMQEGRGIVKGFPDGTFRPGAMINFTEAAKMLYGANHLDSRGLFTAKTGATEPWFESYVLFLESRNAIPVTIMRFDQAITRGEMAEMMYRLKAGVTNKSSKRYQELRSASPAPVATSTSSPGSTTLYSHVRYGFTLTLPTGWTAKEGNIAGGLDGSPPTPSLYDEGKATYIVFSSSTSNAEADLHFSVTCLECWGNSAPEVLMNGNRFRRTDLDGKIYYFVSPPFAPHVYYLFQTTPDREVAAKRILATFQFTKK